MTGEDRKAVVVRLPDSWRCPCGFVDTGTAITKHDLIDVGVVGDEVSSPEEVIELDTMVKNEGKVD